MLTYFTREKRVFFLLVWFTFTSPLHDYWLLVQIWDRTKEDDGTFLIYVLLSWQLIFFFFYLFVFNFSCDILFASNLTVHSVGVVLRAPPGTPSPPSPLTAPKTSSARWPPLEVLSWPLIHSGSLTAWQVATGAGATLASHFLAKPARGCLQLVSAWFEMTAAISPYAATDR